jgi:hypothetical protein
MGGKFAFSRHGRSWMYRKGYLPKAGSVRDQPRRFVLLLPLRLRHNLRASGDE